MIVICNEVIFLPLVCPSSFHGDIFDRCFAGSGPGFGQKCLVGGVALSVERLVQKNFIIYVVRHRSWFSIYYFCLSQKGVSEIFNRSLYYLWEK
jgi:hypothetical protein